MWRRIFPALVIFGLTAGIMTQFVWKMIYFPEPLLPVIAELVVIFTLSGVAIKLSLEKG